MVFRYKLLTDAEKKLAGEEEVVEIQEPITVVEAPVEEKEAEDGTNE